MKTANKFVLALAAVSLVTAAACTDPAYVDPNNPNKNTQQGVLLGGALGAAIGAIASDNSGKGAVAGAIIGAGAGGIYGSVLDKQAADLRNSVGNDVRITNTGDRLIVTLPQDILFATDSASLRPDLQRDIRAVASNLNAYPNSTVQVLGHTDNVGDAGYNQGLSERRAETVALLLINAGVRASRVRSIGRGESQPIASNLTPEGRQLNRRVEIVILPTG